MTSGNDSPTFQHQPAEQQIDMICDEFEAAWREGTAARPEDYLSRLDSSQRATLLRELLALEIDYRRRRGETIEPAELLQRFPEHAAIVSELLPANPQSAIRQPQSIGQYRLLAKIGEGGMGAVYKAMHMRLEKIVALKVLPAERTRDAEALARFNREMKAVGRLQHPNIVGAHDAGEADGVHYLVMEYVEGVDLDRLLKQHGPLPVPDACELVRQAALGLQEAYEHQMVHRDIKPSNLMLTVERSKKQHRGVVKILDLGLALLEEPSQARELTATGQLMGTIDYMSPEQVESTHHVDIRSDVYSLGVTLYKLLTGTSPFAFTKADTAFKRLYAVVHLPPTPIGQHRPDVPRELAALIERMLAKKADDRPATPDEVAEALTPFAGHLNVNVLLAEGKQAATDAGFAESTHPSRLQQTLRPSTPALVPTPSRAARSQFRPAIFVAAAVVIVGGLLLAWRHFIANIVPRDDKALVAHGAGSQSADTEPSPEMPPAQAQGVYDGDNALNFLGGGIVEVPSFKLPREGELTIEAYVTARKTQVGLLPKDEQIRLVGQEGTAKLQIYEGRWNGYAFHNQLHAERPAPANERTHLALVRTATQKRLYVNGRLAASFDAPGWRVDEDPFPFQIGQKDFEGVIDEIRVSNISRYDENFTPHARFEPDVNTLVLYHCDEGQGDVLRDSSGSNHHGKTAGVNWLKPLENAGAPTRAPVPARAPGDELWKLAETQTLELQQLQYGTFFSPAISHDGLALIVTLAINRPGELRDRDLALSTRASRNAPWSPLVSLGYEVNSPGNLNTDEDSYGSISQDQQTLVFFSKREKSDSLWVATRDSATDPFAKAIKLGDDINVKLIRSIYPGLSANARWLTFARRKDSILTGWIAQRNAEDGSYHLARPFGPAIDALGILWRSTVSDDGLTLVCVIGSGLNPFTDNGILWTASRTSTDEAFGSLRSLETSLGGSVGSLNVVLSGEGRTLWVHRGNDLLRLERPGSP